MTAKLDVSVIIVNWNGADHLRICLPSLGSQSLKALEIIVVDNCSSDDSADVAKHFGVRWLPLELNIGLAPALNRGAKAARGDLLLFVNNDMKFDPGFVAALAQPLETDHLMFATDGMQLDWEGTRRGHMATRLSNVLRNRTSFTELVPGLYFYAEPKIEETFVFMASAACMMVRKTLFENLGGFDDRLPLGYEDTEICWRAWVHGLKTLYVPSAICWHRVGGSARSLEAQRFGFRGVLTGRLLLATKYLSARFAFRTWLVSTAGLAKDITGFRWKFAFDRIGVLVRMAGLVPRLLKEKQVLFGKAGTSPDKQLKFLLQLTNEDRPSQLVSPN